MKEFFNDASWIWYTETEETDTYGDFIDNFNYTGGKAICRLSCDGDYVLFVNGVYVSSNQYGDFEHYKIYDNIDITDHLMIGENTIRITVWHLGIASSRYKPAKAGLLKAAKKHSLARIQIIKVVIKKSSLHKWDKAFCLMPPNRLTQPFIIVLL